ncbi:MAG: CHRD domain-containing protein [Chloroflexi bacterium]|nr:CHRD domain-containing protein [Chloroflexota bacterium]
MVVSLLLTVLAGAAVTGAHPETPRVFFARLTGANEVPAPIDTQARGQAVFVLNHDGTELKYFLIATRINNTFMAHIHLAPAGVNGPIAVWLYPEVAFPLPATTPPDSWIPGRFNGLLARGVITAADLTGPLAGQPLSALIAQLEAGNAYVNVHTNDFVAPPNTGPGDFPGGEIRGQVHHH